MAPRLLVMVFCTMLMALTTAATAQPVDVQVIQLNQEIDRGILEANVREILAAEVAKAEQAKYLAQLEEWKARVAATEAQLKNATAIHQRNLALAKEGKAGADAVKTAEKSKQELDAISAKLAAIVKTKPAAAANSAKAEKKKTAQKDEASDDDDAPDSKGEQPPHPRAIKLKMSDGTIIHGVLDASSIEVETKFGVLNVPIAKIRYLKPGLNSKPQRKAEVDGWLEQLASDDPAQRKSAADALKKLGQPVRPLLEPYAKDANATRAKETKTILEWLADQSDFDEFASENENDIRMQDTIATTDFTMTGRIINKAFTLQSDFGELQMGLKDVVFAERDTGQPEIFRKAFAIDQTNLCARGFKTVGLRVEKGDKIVIKASGTIGMTRWGSNAVATPEGAPNYGWYLSGKIANGALCAKIGNGSVFKVGSKFKVTAKEAGTLQFGIGVTDRYAKSTSYRWPGSFKVRVEIERD